MVNTLKSEGCGVNIHTIHSSHCLRVLTLGKTYELVYSDQANYLQGDPGAYQGKDTEDGWYLKQGAESMFFIHRLVNDHPS